MKVLNFYTYYVRTYYSGGKNLSLTRQYNLKILNDHISLNIIFSSGCY